jgi:hypothetical protein
MRAINLGSRLFSAVVASLYFTAPNGKVFSLVNIEFEVMFNEAFLSRLAGPYKNSPWLTEEDYVLYCSE